MGSNVSSIRQRRYHVIDARFITNVALSVYSLPIYLCLFLHICIHMDHIYIEHIYIYLWSISTCAGGLSHRWFERESLIIQIRPYRLYVTNYKVYYINGVSLSYRWKKITENVNHKYQRYHRCIWKMSSAISPSIHLCRWPNWHQTLMYLNQRWLVVSWTLRNKLTWNFNQGAMEKNCCKKSSASINRLNDQLPRDYNKTSVFGTGWIKLTGILQV